MSYSDLRTYASMLVWFLLLCIRGFLRSVHKQYSETYRPTPGDVTLMTAVARNGGGLGLHYGAFLPTLLSQCTPEQLAEWLYPALSMSIIGCLAQVPPGA
jgi:hypothetical protein